ncbi:MAG TPA: hypothetical protein VKV95_12270 [Terriglobia bacterium]|nr:hypothetical protein [Terriglobia bacterium]
MRTARYGLALLALAFLCSVYPTNLKADEWDKKTIITFSGPVDVSGHRLEAGTYVFKLADTADRHVVQIFNSDESHIYATILAIPDYRITPKDKTVIKFSERAGEVATMERDLPETGIPIKEWFYPGDNFGQEFRVKPAVVAEATTTNTATTTTTTAEATPPPPPPAVEEKTEEAPPAAVVAPPEPEPQPAPAQTAEPAPAAPAEMPQTASPMPLIGLIGLISLGVGVSLREILKRTA